MQQADPNRRRILVIDDEEMVLDLITTRLQVCGYQTFIARDGYQGLTRLGEVRPAGVLLDINMPRLDGFSMLRLMRERGVLAETPTMVLSARNQPKDIATAIGLGARDFLTKPFSSEQLLARVARLVRPPRLSQPQNAEARHSPK